MKIVRAYSDKGRIRVTESRLVGHRLEFVVLLSGGAVGIDVVDLLGLDPSVAKRLQQSSAQSVALRVRTRDVISVAGSPIT